MNSETSFCGQIRQRQLKIAITKKERGNRIAPVEEEGFFEGASQAGLLMAQPGAGIAVLPGAIDAVPPVQVLPLQPGRSLLVRRTRRRDVEEQGGRDRGGERDPEEGEGSGGDGEQEGYDEGSRLLFAPGEPRDRHGRGRSDLSLSSAVPRIDCVIVPIFHIYPFEINGITI